MGRVKVFVLESYAELKKVVWPGRDSVLASTKVVVVSTLVFAVFFGLVDFLLSQGIIALFNLV